MAEGPAGGEIKFVWHEGHLKERATSEDSSRRHCLFVQVRHGIPAINRLNLFYQPGS